LSSSPVGYGSTVSAFTINAATGALTPVTGSPFADAGTGADSVAVDPSGTFAYVANYGSNNVSAFTINATTGALAPVSGSPFDAGLKPTFVTVDPSGKFAYVTNSGSNDVSLFAIDATTGALAPVTGSPVAAGGMYPIAITISGIIQ
jgi:YVTN family beta-propeller protein